jgi:hypothetical protein
VVVAPVPDFGRTVFGEAPAAVVLAPAEPTGLFAAAPVVAAGFFAAAVVLVGFFVAPAVVLVPAGFLRGEREAPVVDEVGRVEVVDFVGAVFVVLAVTGFTAGFVLVVADDDETDVLDLETPPVVVALAEPVGRVVPVADFPDVGRAGDRLAVVLVVVVGLLVAPVVRVAEEAGDLGAVDFEAADFVGDVFATDLVGPDR